MSARSFLVRWGGRRNGGGDEEAARAVTLVKASSGEFRCCQTIRAALQTVTDQSHMQLIALLSILLANRPLRPPKPPSPSFYHRLFLDLAGGTLPLALTPLLVLMTSSSSFSLELLSSSLDSPLPLNHFFVPLFGTVLGA